MISNDEKIIYNSDEKRCNARRELIYRVLDVDEMKYLSRHYAEAWKEIFDYLCQESYTDEGQAKVKVFRNNVGGLVRTVFPKKNFNWELEVRKV